jgi:hypothetical protein
MEQRVFLEKSIKRGWICTGNIGKNRKMLLNYPEIATMCRTGFLDFSGVIFSGERFSDE